MNSVVRDHEYDCAGRTPVQKNEAEEEKNVWLKAEVEKYECCLVTSKVWLQDKAIARWGIIDHLAPSEAAKLFRIVRI